MKCDKRLLESLPNVKVKNTVLNPIYSGHGKSGDGFGFCYVYSNIPKKLL